MSINKAHRCYKCYKNMNVRDAVKNLKLKTGEKENTAPRDVRGSIQQLDNLTKVTNGTQKQRNEGFNQYRTNQVGGCLERNTVKKQNKKCQKAVNSHTIISMEAIMEKSIQKNARFVENLKKGFSFITKTRIEKTMKKIILLQSVISVTIKYTFQKANGVRINRGDLNVF
jgi:hypothetical protein